MMVNSLQVGTRVIKNIAEFTSTVSSIVSESESTKKEVSRLGEKSTDKSSKGWVKATFNNGDGTSHNRIKNVGLTLIPILE